MYVDPFYTGLFIGFLIGVVFVVGMALLSGKKK